MQDHRNDAGFLRQLNECKLHHWIITVSDRASARFMTTWADRRSKKAAERSLVGRIVAESLVPDEIRGHPAGAVREHINGVVSWC